MQLDQQDTPQRRSPTRESRRIQSLAEAVCQDDTGAVKKGLHDIAPNDVVWPEDGWTLLHEAVAHHDVEIVRALLDKGANVNARTHLGYTPLMRAALKGRGTVIDMLLKHGADISPRDDQGMTAMDFAEGAGRTEIAERLRKPIVKRIMATADSPEMREFVLAPLDKQTLQLIRLSRKAAGGRVRTFVVTFMDGASVRVSVLEECVAALPKEHAFKRIQTITVYVPRDGLECLECVVSVDEDPHIIGDLYHSLRRTEDASERSRMLVQASKSLLDSKADGKFEAGLRRYVGTFESMVERVKLCIAAATE